MNVSPLPKKHRAERGEQKGSHNVVCALACYHASHGAVQTTARTGVQHRGHGWHSCCPEGQQGRERGANWEHNQNTDKKQKECFVFLFFSIGNFVVKLLSELQQMK